MTKSPEIYRLTEENHDKIQVKHSGTIILQSFDDYPDGKLAVAERGEGGNIPFDIKRFYFINDLRRNEAVRGKHAHRNLQQLMFCLSGSFDLLLDDGERQQVICLEGSRSHIGIILGRLLWHEMTNFSPDCVILVLANDVYKKEDYIRDYDEFLRILKESDSKKVAG